MKILGEIHAAHRQKVNDPTCRAQVRPGKKVVLGVGSVDAKIMFIGEAPGAEEEIQGAFASYLMS